MRTIVGLTSCFIGPEDRRCFFRGGVYYLTRPYLAEVSRAGAVPIPLPHAVDPDELEQLLDRIDGLVMTGGKDLNPSWYGQKPHPASTPTNPERSESDIAFARRAIERRMPILAICLGMQTLNVALGGSLWQDIPSQRPSDLEHRQAEPDWDRLGHSVKIESGSLLHRVVKKTRIKVNSRHHQAVDRLGKGLVVTAQAPDGIVEAVELPGVPFCLGVQWHPEGLGRYAPHRALFEAFVGATIDYRKRQRKPVPAGRRARPSVARSRPRG